MGEEMCRTYVESDAYNCGVDACVQNGVKAKATIGSVIEHKIVNLKTRWYCERN